MKRERSFQRKLLPIILLLAAVPLFLFSIVALVSLRSILVDRYEEQVESDLGQSEKLMNITLDRYEAVLDAAASDEERGPPFCWRTAAPSFSTSRIRLQRGVNGWRRLPGTGESRQIRREIFPTALCPERPSRRRTTSMSLEFSAVSRHLRRAGRRGRWHSGWMRRFCGTPWPGSGGSRALSAMVRSSSPPQSLRTWENHPPGPHGETTIYRV